MTRQEQLKAAYDALDADSKKIVAPIIDEVQFIEEQMQELKKLPFIYVNPRNPAQQRTTPAAKQYKELTQAYSGFIKILLTVLNRTEGTETSPLREYLESLKER